MNNIRSCFHQWYYVPKALFRLGFIIINNCYCIPTYVIWMILLTPLRKINPETFWRIEGYFFHWLLAMVSTWSWSAGYDVMELGDDITDCLEEKTLVIANHQSTADVPLLMACFNTKKNVLPNLMWIMDSLFKYTNFGIVSVLHQDFFIKSRPAIYKSAARAMVFATIKSEAIVKSLKLPNVMDRLLILAGNQHEPIAQRYCLQVITNLVQQKDAKKLFLEQNLKKIENIYVGHDDLAKTLKERLLTDVLTFYYRFGKDKRDQSIHELIAHLLESYIPRSRKWMVLFPEGGFLRKRRAVSQKYALKNDLPVLNNVSLPRVGALHAIMNTIGPVRPANNNAITENTYDMLPKLAWVLDITIAYPNGEPLDLKTIIFGHREPCKTILFYRLFSCKDIPHESEALSKWLYDRFEEKEHMLEKFYTSGQFPTDEYSSNPIQPHLVAQDCLRFIILHLFFITSTYIHLQMFMAAYDYCHYLIN